MEKSIGNEQISEQELRTLNEPAENQDLIAFPEWTEYRKKGEVYGGGVTGGGHRVSR